MAAITIDGIEYVPCKSAAETAGLVSDYIARLCRRGIVRGIKIGRAWYVNDQSLKDFLITQAYRNELRRENLTHDRRQEHQRAQLMQSLAQTPPATIRAYAMSRPRIIMQLENALTHNAHTITQAAGGGAAFNVLSRA